MFSPSSLAVTGLWIAATALAPIGSGESLRTPAQRHLVRMKPPGGGTAYLLAVQQEGEQGRGLGFFRSDDEMRTWRYYAPIQNDYHHADRADLLPVGKDLALVYSFEDSFLSGSAAHDVYFQWWRFEQNTQDWRPTPPVRVFDSTSNQTGYSRAELARDSHGRLWVQAFRLEPDGSSTAVIAVSVDDGATFQVQPELDRVPKRGGGRLIHLGTKLLFVYDCHDCGGPARMRIRKDSDALTAWEAATEAFPDGIYHGAALSAVADGRGGLELFYKNHDQQLFYRHFDGTTFGLGTLVEEHGDWALQAASTRIDNDVVLFYNAPRRTNTDYQLRMRTLRKDVLSAPVVLDDSTGFKGYLASPETLPANTPAVPCAYGSTPDADSKGIVALVTPLPPENGDDPSRGDAGVPGRGPPLTSGAPDAGTPASGSTPESPDAGLPGDGNVYTDDFSRSSNPGLGPDWLPVTGSWFDNGQRAVSDFSGPNQTTAVSATCANCRVEAWVTSYGADAGLYLRALTPTGGDRYDLLLRSDGTLQLRRVRQGSIAILGQAPSGLCSLDDPSVLSLAALWSNPVWLYASVNGDIRLWATDTSRQALSGPGYAGLWTDEAGVVFDTFRLRPELPAGPPGHSGR